jgi:hypothetical protein
MVFLADAMWLKFKPSLNGINLDLVYVPRDLSLSLA